MCPSGDFQILEYVSLTNLGAFEPLAGLAPDCPHGKHPTAHDPSAAETAT